MRAGRYRAGRLAVLGLAGMLLLLTLLRASLAQRVYGAASEHPYDMGLTAWGNDAWLAGLGLALMALALWLRQVWLKRLLLWGVFALALAMALDSLLLDFMSLRLHMADVLKFGGEGQATLEFAGAALRGGHLLLPLLAAGLLLLALGLFFPLPDAPGQARALLLLALLLIGSGLWLGRSASGYVHREGVINLLQLQAMRGVNQPYSVAFVQGLRATPPAADMHCEEGQAHRPDIVLVIWESLSAYHSGLLGGLGQTPELDAMAAHGSWFSAFHANGFTTDQGLIALLDGRVPIPAVGRYLSLKAFDGFGDPQQAVPGVLRKAGYESAFFTTASLDFLDQRSWLGRMQWDHFEGAESRYYDGMPRGPFNAASDQALYGRLLQWLDAGRWGRAPRFLAALSVDSHPPFLNRETGQLDEASVFGAADAALGQLYRALQARDFFRNGILIVTGDHRSMTLIRPWEWQRWGQAATARVPLVVIGASGLPPGEIGGAFQQTDLLPSLAQMTGEGRICRHEGQGSFLRPDPQPPDYVLHARGDWRGRVDIHYPEGLAWVELDGDDSRIFGIHPERSARIARHIHADRIARGQIAEDLPAQLMDWSRHRWQQP